jgi:DNA-binding NarL/FixJ family response regulator
VDDEPVVLRMIRRTLSSRGLSNTETASSAAAALALAGRRYDLALVDVNLGAGRTGVDLVRDLRAAGFGGRVCMLTCDEDPGTILRALVAGADGYLLKRGEDLGRDVEEILSRSAGEIDAVAARDTASFGMYLRSAGLTAESIDVLVSFAEAGFPENKPFADRIGRTVAATSKMITRAEEKLGLSNRAQLARLLTILSGFGLRGRRDGG